MSSKCKRINELFFLPHTKLVEKVKFYNVKPKYYLNEDILLDYLVDAEVQPSYRDWIGLYPRGWNNLLQYITFEWIIIPSETSRKRSILFRCRYHSSVVDTDREYQFIYINNKIKVLGWSRYFRFLPVDIKGKISVVPNGKSLRNFWIQNDTISQQVLSASFCSDVPLILPHTVQENEPEIPKHSVHKGSSFRHPVDISSTHQTSDNKVNSSVQRLCYMDDQIRSMKERIRDLENDLMMNEVTQKQLKHAAQRSKKERQIYQKFVNELLLALKQKGVVRVIDNHGLEMLVKRVSNGLESNVLEEHSPQNMVKTSHKERFLKAVVGSQEQTIRELLLRLETTSQACDNLTRKIDRVTTEENSVEEEIQENMQNINQAVETPIAIISHGQGDAIMGIPEHERPDNNSNNNNNSNLIPESSQQSENRTPVLPNDSMDLSVEFQSCEELEASYMMTDLKL